MAAHEGFLPILDNSQNLNDGQSGFPLNLCLSMELSLAADVESGPRHVSSHPPGFSSSKHSPICAWCVRPAACVYCPFFSNFGYYAMCISPGLSLLHQVTTTWIPRRFTIHIFPYIYSLLCDLVRIDSHASSAVFPAVLTRAREKEISCLAAGAQFHRIRSGRDREGSCPISRRWRFSIYPRWQELAYFCIFSTNISSSQPLFHPCPRFQQPIGVVISPRCGCIG